jgi:hypothetical protein
VDSNRPILVDGFLFPFQAISSHMARGSANQEKVITDWDASTSTPHCLIQAVIPILIVHWSSHFHHPVKHLGHRDWTETIPTVNPDVAHPNVPINGHIAFGSTTYEGQLVSSSLHTSSESFLRPLELGQSLGLQEGLPSPLVLPSLQAIGGICSSTRS